MYFKVLLILLIPVVSSFWEFVDLPTRTYVILYHTNYNYCIDFHVLHNICFGELLNLKTRTLVWRRTGTCLRYVNRTFETILCKTKRVHVLLCDRRKSRKRSLWEISQLWLIFRTQSLFNTPNKHTYFTWFIQTDIQPKGNRVDFSENIDRKQV